MAAMLWIPILMPLVCMAGLLVAAAFEELE